MTEIFTWGSGQEFPNRYIKITADNPRDTMFELFGPRWSMRLVIAIVSKYR